MALAYVLARRWLGNEEFGDGNDPTGTSEVESLNHMGNSFIELCWGIKISSELVLEKSSGLPKVFDSDVVASRN